MPATLATVLPLLREHYHENITDIFFTADKVTTPVLADMESKAMDDGLGRGYVVPVEYGTGSSASPTFSVAQGKAQGATTGNSALRDRWIVQAATIDAVCNWTRDSMLAAQGKGATELFDVMQREMDSKISLVKKRLAHAAVERGYGRIGVITAITSTTITLDTSVINRVDVGDDLRAADAEASGAFRTGTIAITAIDPDTGVLTMASNPDTNWDVGDFVFHEGYREATAASYLLPVGLAGWIPETAPSGAFMNITRTGIPNLCGHRVDATGLDHAYAFIRAVNRLHKFGSKASVIKCSDEDYTVLCADKDATKTVEISLGKYGIGFDGVTVSTLAGRIPVVPDAMIPQGVAWCGPFDDKKFAPFLAHNDDLVNVDDIDGNEITRGATTTDLEMRLYFRGAIACPAPGKFAVIHTLPSS